MSSSGKRVPKDRWSQTRLATSRGLHRARRKGKRYRGFYDFRSDHAPQRNPNYHADAKGKFRGRETIDIPARLDCADERGWSELAGVLARIRKATLQDRYRRVVLNFHDVTSMAPEAAVAILAEIQRCEEYCNPRTDITGTYPASQDMAVLLCDVGFFKALDIREPKRPKEFSPRTYVQIERGNSTASEKADELLNCFAEVAAFEAEDRKRLYVAILESMDNVFEHAYPLASNAPHLIHEWWLLGYSDRVTGTIGFIFYDQGAGIPETIRRRQKGRVMAALAGWSDGKWIERAVMKGMSRHTSKRRGHGLQKLKEFIARLDAEGSLSVVANTGYLKCAPSGVDVVSTIANELHGTIVVWQLSGFGIPKPKSASGD